MKSKIEQLKEWMTEILRYSRGMEGDELKKSFDEFVLTAGEENSPEEHWSRFYLYTQDHIYSISARERYFVNDDGSRGSGVGGDYLGCTVVTRKPRAGEDWNRGNDLADGPLNRETWEKIKNDIIGYELVKLVPKPNYIAEDKTPSEIVKPLPEVGESAQEPLSKNELGGGERHYRGRIR